MVRRSWAFWATPVLLGLIFFYAGDHPPVEEGYWPAATSAGTLFLSFIAPACAACAAWEGYRARRLGAAVGSPARSPVRIMAGACWPIGVLAVTTVALVLWIYAPAPGTPGGPDLRILGVQMLLLTAHTAAGYAIGRALPVVIAVPLAAMGSFLATTVGLGLEPVWIRHIGATSLDTCCSLDEVPTPEVLVASALFAAGFITTALFILAARRPLTRTASIVPLLAGTGVAASLVMPLDWLPTSPRPLSEADCTEDVPRLCLWPEQERSAVAIRTSVSEILIRLDAAGIEYSDAIDPILFTHSSPGRYELVATTVGGLMPVETEDCPLGYPEWSYQLRDRTVAWLYLTAGLEELSFPSSVDPGSVDAAISVRTRLSSAEQRQWFETNIAVLEECPPADPPPGLDADLTRGHSS